ncbi:unnamed protein product [Calypogeia fissa]
MTLDGTKYVLASAHIKAGIQRLQSKSAIAEVSGSPISSDDQRTELKSVVKMHIDEWKTKVSKMVTVMNPEYKGFFDKCVDLYNWCEKTRKEGHLQDDQVKKNVQCGLDKCRIYASSAVSNAPWYSLLKASVKPDLRDIYQHPSKLAELDIKAWISRHGVWESVLGLASCALDGIMDEIMTWIPESRLLSTINGLPTSLRDEIQYDLVQYKEVAQFKYFSRI